MKTSILILFLISICSCGHNVKTEDVNSVIIDTNKYYFPLAVFADTASYVGRDTSFVERYTEDLKALGELSLFKSVDSEQVYRLLWLRTCHNPIAIRIQNDKDTYKLYWKVTSGKGGYEPGKLTIFRS